MNIKKGFYIPPGDRKYAAVGCILIVLCVLVYRFSEELSPLNDGMAGNENAVSVDRRNGESVKSAAFEAAEGGKVELSEFDPNTADSEQLLKLGLQPWMVRNIYRYRAAGGVYRKPSDFARLYGLTKKQYEMLAPYIRIGSDYQPAADFYGEAEDNGAMRQHEDKPVARDTVKYPFKLKPGEYVAVNSADTVQLKKIPGIGSSYANAIVRYRDRLGGFYAVAQLMEIDGVPETAMQYVKVDASAIKKININRLAYRQLRQHPYINFYQARDIVDYRRLHGDMKSLAELKLLDSFTKGDLERLKYYVEF